MAKQYMLGTDDNMVQVIDITFTRTDNIHWLDNERQIMAAGNIRLGRIVPTGIPDIPDEDAGLPPLSPTETHQGESADVTYTPPTSSGVDPGTNSVGSILDQLVMAVLYVPPEIESFTVSPSRIEYGTYNQVFTFDWGLNRDPLHQEIDNGIGYITPTSLRTKQQSLTLLSDTTFTLTIDDAVATKTKTALVNVTKKIFYGVYSEEILPTLSILNGELTDFRSLTKTLDAGTGNYIYIAYPETWGDGIFKFDDTITVPVEHSPIMYSMTSDGHTTNTLYKVYRTEYPQQGTMLVELS